MFCGLHVKLHAHTNALVLLVRRTMRVHGLFVFMSSKLMVPRASFLSTLSTCARPLPQPQNSYTIRLSITNAAAPICPTEKEAQTCRNKSVTPAERRQRRGRGTRHPSRWTDFDTRHSKRFRTIRPTAMSSAMIYIWNIYGRCWATGGAKEQRHAPCASRFPPNPRCPRSS